MTGALDDQLRASRQELGKRRRQWMGADRRSLAPEHERADDLERLWPLGAERAQRPGDRAVPDKSDPQPVTPGAALFAPKVE
jgi:hypothetical protein